MQAPGRHSSLRSSAWRTELLALLDAPHAVALGQGARVAGFEAPKTFDEPSEASTATPAITTGAAPAVHAERHTSPALRGASKKPIAPVVAAHPPTVPVPFWRFTRMTWRDEKNPPVARRVVEEGLTDDDWKSSGRSVLAGPGPEPELLAPWRRLWPSLRNALGATRTGREPDLAALVARWSRGEYVTRIPRKTRRAWAERASLWIDRSERLLPFAHDQDMVRSHLERLFAKGNLEVHVLEGTATPPAEYRRNACVPVLVLGDLGAYGEAAVAARWESVARDLRRDGVRVTALLPVPRVRWPEAARVWSSVEWERAPLANVHPHTMDASFWSARADRLRDLASIALLVEPGLLRALRRLLPPEAADASTEADVWNHASVRDAAWTGMRLKPEVTREGMKRLAAGNREVRVGVARLLREWHGVRPKELLRREILDWEAANPGDDTFTEAEQQDAVEFALRLATSTVGAERRTRAATELRRFTRVALAPLTKEAYTRWPTLQRAWVAAWSGIAGASVPEGVDVIAASAEVEPEGALTRWSVRQVAGALVLRTADEDVWCSPDDTGGSPVAWLHATRSSVFVLRDDLRQEPLREGLALPLQVDEGMTLDTGRCAVTVEACAREPWMRAMGRDRFGLWAESREGGIRFRWIPPGRFVMGSPKREAGRIDDEVQHEVTLTRGYWLGETPVTQVQWVAVGGHTNPSYFQSPNRPVERVSWNDAVAFAKAVGARLPTEAEWEHACRAGTTTATWVGDLALREKNHAPVLDAIAWYGGNSGVGFDLPNGIDISEWMGKQPVHTRTGTRAVRGKAPNPLGLYDMLGNVWEWCSDRYGTYAAGAVSDPTGPATGTYRVMRGASWSNPASYVRAGRRDANSPADRGYGLGFRLARDQT